MQRRMAIAATMIALAGTSAFGAGIESTPWTVANIDTLRSSDRAAVIQFLSEEQGPNDITHFRWYDLAGDGKYELLVDGIWAPDHAGLFVYWQEAPGKFRSQESTSAAVKIATS